jgi:hypothetical protein
MLMKICAMKATNLAMTCADFVISRYFLDSKYYFKLISISFIARNYQVSSCSRMRHSQERRVISNRHHAFSVPMPTADGCRISTNNLKK